MRDTIRAHAAQFDTQYEAVIGTTIQGEIVYWNRAAERLYGWTAREAEGRDILDVTPTDLSREEAATIMLRLQAGRSWSGEFRARGRTGAEFAVRVRDVPVRDERGELIGLVGVSHAIG